MKCDKCGYDWGDSGDSAHACAFYQTLKPSTHSPQRTWVGLTWEDANEIAIEHDVRPSTVKAIEAKLKEKNNG